MTERADYVLDAALGDYLPCPVCHAWRFDPCRTPAGRSRKPHKGRPRANEDPLLRGLPIDQR